MTEIAKESGHWYKSDGTPAYTYQNAKGETKKTTLRQARKENLYPSVTTVMKIMAAPGLEIWKQTQILQAAATLPAVEGETTDDWCKRVIIDAGEHGKQAREKGTAIHGAIERHFLGKPHDYISEVGKVCALLAGLGIKHVYSEKSFASNGYAGKVDFIGEDKDGHPVIIDFKTTDFAGKKKKTRPEMVIQLAAYAAGTGYITARVINIFISRNLAGPEVDYYEWDHDEINTGMEQFELLLRLWRLQKRYAPK